MFDNVMIIVRLNGEGAEWEGRVCFCVKRAETNETLQYMWAVHTLAQSSQEQHQSREM